MQAYAIVDNNRTMVALLFLITVQFTRTAAVILDVVPPTGSQEMLAVKMLSRTENSICHKFTQTVLTLIEIFDLSNVPLLKNKMLCNSLR